MNNYKTSVAQKMKTREACGRGVKSPSRLSLPQKEKKPFLRYKTALENAVFQVAARNGFEIRARKGRLHAQGAEGVLAALLDVYNRFFASGNLRFLRQDNARERLDNEAFFRQYRRERERLALRAAFYLSAQKQ